MDISLLLDQASECNTYADIDASYNCLKEQYGIKDDQLILYGQSVGSGPTIDLASRTPNLRGVVLHSPILSGMRVLYPVKRTYWFDIYKVSVDILLCLVWFSCIHVNTHNSSFQNIDKISTVTCPVLVIHVSDAHSSVCFFFLSLLSFSLSFDFLVIGGSSCPP